MRLTGKVVRVESGAEFTDKRPRIMIRVREASIFNNTILVPNDTETFPLSLDEEVIVEVIPVGITAMRKAYEEGLA